MRVMIVDDNPMNCVLLERMIRKIEPCAPVSFTDPLLALSESAATPFSIALIDYLMPGVNGIEFITILRQLAGWKETPVLLVTSSGEQQVRRAALAAGAAGFVMKPIDPVVLTRLVRRILKLPAPALALPSTT